MTRREARRSCLAGANPIIEDRNAAVDHSVRVLGLSSIGRAREVLHRCRVAGVTSSRAGATRDLQARGSGWKWKLLEQCRRTGRRSGTSQPTILGPAKCRSRIRTAPCCALDRSQRKTNRRMNGWICMAGADFPARGRRSMLLRGKPRRTGRKGTGPRINAHRAEV